MLIHWNKLENVRPLNTNISDYHVKKALAVPTRTEQTEREYFDFAMKTIEAVRLYTGITIDDEISCQDIRRWLEANRVTYRSSSWRYARASFANLLERALAQITQAASSLTDAKAIDEAEKTIEDITQTLSLIRKMRWALAPLNQGKTAAQRSKELPPKSSSNKKKHVPAETLFRLDQYISYTGSEWQRRAMKLAWATLFTGLRPSEWEDAAFTEEGKTLLLVVQNAKNTNGRANGAQREIVVTADEAVTAVKAQIESVSQWKQTLTEADSDFKKSYVPLCANALRIAQEQYFGKSHGITPYSFRHQFSANLKSQNFSKEAIAALMGHASKETAGQHYGKKRYGYGGIVSRRGDAMAAKMPEDFAQKIQLIAIALPEKVKTEKPQSSLNAIA